MSSNSRRRVRLNSIVQNATQHSIRLSDRVDCRCMNVRSLINWNSIRSCKCSFAFHGLGTFKTIANGKNGHGASIAFLNRPVRGQTSRISHGTVFFQLIIVNMATKMRRNCPEDQIEKITQLGLRRTIYSSAQKWLMCIVRGTIAMCVSVFGTDSLSFRNN